VVFLVSQSTASASEIVINGLEPLVRTWRVGTTTFGKPVGADTFRRCNIVVSPITFRSLNTNRQGDYFGGILPSCFSPGDDLEHDLGSPEEARLAKALTLLETGACFSHETLPSTGVPAAVGPIDGAQVREQLRRLTEGSMPGML
jgi:hypothetical protein